MAENQESALYQRRIWDESQKRIDALIKKLNPSNIGDIITELFFNNLVRSRGVLCRSILKASVVSPDSIPVLASLVAVINSQIPEIGYLLLKRIIVEFRPACARKEKMELTSMAKMVAHLVNHGVVYLHLVREVMVALLMDPSEDNVEIAVTCVLECGYWIERVDPLALDDCFGRLYEIKRLKKGRKSMCLITGLFDIRRDGFVGFQEPEDDLDFVEIDEQVTHKISFLDNLDPEYSLDSFGFDLEFMENEGKFAVLREEFLGEDSSN